MKSTKHPLRTCDLCLHYSTQKGVVQKWSGDDIYAVPKNVMMKGSFCLRYRVNLEDLRRAKNCKQFKSVTEQMILGEESA